MALGIGDRDRAPQGTWAKNEDGTSYAMLLIPQT